MAIDRLGGEALITNGTLAFDNDTLVVDGTDNQVGVGVTPSAKFHVQGTGTSDIVRIDTDGSGSRTNHAPELALRRMSGSPQDGDALASVEFTTENDGGGLISYASIAATANDVTAGSEDGKLKLRVQENSQSEDRIIMDENGTGINTDPESTVLGVASDTVGVANGLHSLTTQGGVRIDKAAVNDTPGIQPSLSLVTSHNSNSPGPELDLRRISTSPTANDTLGRVNFIGRNSADEDHLYAQINTKIRTATNGSEDGSVAFRASRGGSVVNYLEFDMDDGDSPSNGEVCINTGQLDINFRVKGDDTSHLLLCDAGTDTVRIGTDSPQSGSTQLTVQKIDSTGRALDVYRPTTGNTNHIANFYSDVSGTATIQQVMEASGDIESRTSSLTGTSDRTLKENITDATNQWEDIKALSFKNFNFIGEPDRPMLGVIAQDVQEAGMTNLVKTNSESGKLSVKYSVMFMKATIALQEAMSRIETLETKVTALENA